MINIIQNFLRELSYSIRVLVPVGVVAVVLLACYLPARRASKVNPLVALRIE